MIITTTPQVDGYTIKDYLGPVSGADTYLPGGVVGEGILAKRQSSLISGAYSAAVAQMKERCPDADAIVGLSMVITSMTSGNVIVAVSGTAVTLSAELKTKGPSAITVPVNAANFSTPFLPTDIKIYAGESKPKITLTVINNGGGKLGDMKAYLEIYNKFGDSVKCDDVCFLDFTDLTSRRAESAVFPVDIPLHIIGSLSSCSVIIRKYYYNDVLRISETLDLVTVDELRKNTKSMIDKDTIIEQLSQLSNARNMLAEIENFNLPGDDPMYVELKKVLEERMQFERLFGGSKKASIDAVRKVLEDF